MTGQTFYTVPGALLREAAAVIEAYRKREFAEHIIATDAARDASGTAPLADLLAEAIDWLGDVTRERRLNNGEAFAPAFPDDVSRHMEALRRAQATLSGRDAGQATPTTPLELRQQRIIAALSARLGEADAKNMVAARDARQHPLRTIFTKADPHSVKWDTSTGFESAAEMSAVQIEARAAGLQSGMTFRAVVQQCMRTSDNAMRPVGWPRGYCFVLSGAAGNLTMPGMQGGPVTISADEILGPWVVLPIAQVQREAAERAADGVEIR